MAKNARLRQQPQRSRFFAGYLWLILKNLLGWTLILVSLVAGPLVPGPGGIPLFLIGFALITFPGKRRLTARALRGRPIQLRQRLLIIIAAAFSLVVPAVMLWILGSQWAWLHEPQGYGLLRFAAAYLTGALLVALFVVSVLFAVNLLLRCMPPARRRVRPWLRKHRIRLLPPRHRHRLPHEQGHGPFRLKDEILTFLKHPRHGASSGG